MGTYEKRGRPYNINETLVVDEDSLGIVRRLSHGTLVSQEHKAKVL